MKKILIMVVAGLVFASYVVAQPQVEQGKEMLKQANYPEAMRLFRNVLRFEPKNDQAWFYLSKTFYLANMPDSAIFAANKAKSLNDENYDAYVVLAEAQLALKNNKDAYATTKSGLKANKDFEPLVRTLGQVYLAMDSTDAATVAFTKAQDMNAKDPAVYEGLADAYLKNGVTALAITNYRNALDLDSTQSDMWYKLARTYQKDRQWNESAVAFQKVIALDPANDDARLELADMYCRAKLWLFAARWYKPYVEKHPEAKDVVQKYVEALYLSRQYKEVIPLAEKMLKDSTNSVNLLRMLAYSNVQVKNYSVGIGYYGRLQKIESLSTDDLRKLALAYTETKQDSLAASSVEQILKSDSTNTAMYAELGAIYMKIHQYDKAAENFEKRFKSDTTNYSAYYNYASCMMVLQEFEKASKAYMKVLELNPPGAFPQVASSQYFLGGCYLQMKMYPEARKAFEGYLKLTDTVETKYKKDRASSYKYVGLFALLDKRYEEGVKLERKSIELENNDSDAHTWLGQCYHNLQTNDNFPNARENAIKEYKIALQINKNNKDAQKLLNLLEPQ